MTKTLIVGLLLGTIAMPAAVGPPEATLIAVVPKLTLTHCLAHRDILRKMFAEIEPSVSATIQCAADVP